MLSAFMKVHYSQQHDEAKIDNFEMARNKGALNHNRAVIFSKVKMYVLQYR